jgi:hypothetical protein
MVVLYSAKWALVALSDVWKPSNRAAYCDSSALGAVCASHDTRRSARACRRLFVSPECTGGREHKREGGV